MWLPENSAPFHHKHKQCNPLSSLLYLDCFQSKESETPNATSSFILRWDLQSLYIASGTSSCLPFQCLDCVFIMHVLLEIHKQVFIEVTQCHTKEEKARQSYDLLWCLTVMTTALTEALKVLGWTWNTRCQRCWYKFKACLSYWVNSRPTWAACGSSISKWKCRKRAGDIAQW